MVLLCRAFVGCSILVGDLGSQKGIKFAEIWHSRDYFSCFCLSHYTHRHGKMSVLLRTREVWDSWTCESEMTVDIQVHIWAHIQTCVSAPVCVLLSRTHRFMSLRLHGYDGGLRTFFRDCTSSFSKFGCIESTGALAWGKYLFYPSVKQFFILKIQKWWILYIDIVIPLL